VLTRTAIRQRAGLDGFIRAHLKFCLCIKSCDSSNLAHLHTSSAYFFSSSALPKCQHQRAERRSTSHGPSDPDDLRLAVQRLRKSRHHISYSVKHMESERPRQAELSSHLGRKRQRAKRSGDARRRKIPAEERCSKICGAKNV